jgi:hypothetical protein
MGYLEVGSGSAEFGRMAKGVTYRVSNRYWVRGAGVAGYELRVAGCGVRVFGSWKWECGIRKNGKEPKVRSVQGALNEGNRVRDTD